MGAGAVAGTRVGVGVAHMRDGSDQPPRRAAFAAKRTRSRSRVRAPQVCPPDGGLCITQRSIQCNGIRADMVKMQPSFAEVADRIFTILNGAAHWQRAYAPRSSAVPCLGLDRETRPSPGLLVRCRVFMAAPRLTELAARAGAACSSQDGFGVDTTLSPLTTSGACGDWHGLAETGLGVSRQRRL